MPDSYSWFLAFRYLVTRWVNILGVLGVALAVWALIVVIAVFSGFIDEIRSHIRGASADLALTGIAAPASYEALAEIIEADPDVIATAPRLQHYGVLFPYGGLRQRIILTNAADSSPLEFNFVDLIGVDFEREQHATDFATWLKRPTDGQAVIDLETPFTVSDKIQTQSWQRRGLSPDQELLRASPGLLIGHSRMTRGELLFRGQLIDLISARFEHDSNTDDPEDNETLIRIRKPLILSGSFETRHRLFDDTRGFVDIEVMRSLMGHDELDPNSIDIVTEVAIKVAQSADLELVRDRIEAAIKPTSGESSTVKTWEEQNAIFLGAVDQERNMMKIVLFAVMLVAGFLIYATLHMMVTQKIKEIGILTSMGATPTGIAGIFLISGITVTIIGCLLGTTTGCLSAHYLNDVNNWMKVQFDMELFPIQIYNLSRIPYRLDSSWISQVVGGALLLSVIVAYLPARRAARLNPIKALSYE